MTATHRITLVVRGRRWSEIEEEAATAIAAYTRNTPEHVRRRNLPEATITVVPVEKRPRSIMWEATVTVDV